MMMTSYVENYIYVYSRGEKPNGIKYIGEMLTAAQSMDLTEMGKGNLPRTQKAFCRDITSIIAIGKA